MAASSRAAVGLLALAALSGCGHSRVGEKSFAALPLESKLHLIEAENDLFVAVDAVDEASIRVRDTREEYEKSDERVRAAKEAMKLAEGAKDRTYLEIAQLSFQESKERRAWLGAWLEVQRKLLEAEKAKLELARGRFERTKVQIAKGAHVAGAQKVATADSDPRIAKLEADAKRATDRAQKEAESAEKAKSVWSATRRALSKKTGGGQGSPWVE